MLKEGIYKFVRLENGDYIFENMKSGAEHNTIVPSEKKPVAAGTIAVGRKYLIAVDRRSLSLKIGFGRREQEELSQLLQKEWKDD